GNMFWNRNKGNIIIRMIAPILFKYGRSERFRPDLCIEGGFSFSQYGFDAKALHIPGHSKGSIGILTADGDLICGDLLENTEQPDINSIMDDLETANKSIEKLRSLKVDTIYPGHGKPFLMELLLNKWTEMSRGI
ncbi:unnamed protein product, partial [marine sediment metagenome]